MKNLIPIIFTFFLSNIAFSQQNSPWPEWVFHHWVWEDESTQQSATSLVDDYLARDIPVGAIIIDSPWETGYNTFEFDTNLFNDAQGMINYFHTKDVKTLLWITTMINIDEPLHHYADSLGYFLEKNAQGDTVSIKWWKGRGNLIDFHNPEAVSWYETLVDKALALGIDGWKCDGADNPFQSITPYSPYADSTITRLEYSHAYYRFFFEKTRSELGNDRIIMARPVDNYGIDNVLTEGEVSEFAPINITFAGWVGDQDGTFEGLKWALNNMYHSARKGYLAFGSDIGGYRNDDNFPQTGRGKELFIRWAQVGAFSPLMENGGGGEHRPWKFDNETTTIYRDFTKLHYRLIPYFMEIADSAYNKQESMLSFFNKTDYSYMLGQDLFITPFLTSGTNITVNFPPTDNWVYLFDTAKVYAGGTTETLDIPLSEFPVFVKEGTKLEHKLVSSINELNQLQNPITLYPNPANDFVEISIKNTVNFQQLSILDVTGKIVWNTNNLTTEKVRVNIESLSSGIYFIQLVTGDKQWNKKIVIN